MKLLIRALGLLVAIIGSVWVFDYALSLISRPSDLAVILSFVIVVLLIGLWAIWIDKIGRRWVKEKDEKVVVDKPSVDSSSTDRVRN